MVWAQNGFLGWGVRVAPSSFTPLSLSIEQTFFRSPIESTWQTIVQGDFDVVCACVFWLVFERPEWHCPLILHGLSWLLCEPNKISLRIARVCRYVCTSEYVLLFLVHIIFWDKCTHSSLQAPTENMVFLVFPRPESGHAWILTAVLPSPYSLWLVACVLRFQVPSGHRTYVH